MPADEFQLPPPEGSKPFDPKDPIIASMAEQIANDAPTPAAEWRSARKKGFVVTLPSGHKALVRRTLDLFAKLEKGEIPNPLAAVVVKMIEENRTAVDEEELGTEGIIQMMNLFDETCEAMMISPMFQRRPADAPPNWEPNPGCIGSDDLDLEDKVFLFSVSQGGVADAATFRKESLNAVAGGSDSGSVQLQAVEPA